MDFELVVKNGTVVDGTGRPRFQANLGIRDGKIAAVASGIPLNGAEELDAAGLIVAPGFIDIHSHLDWHLSHPDHVQVQAPIVLQGITTALTGHCGSSPAPVTEGSAPLVTGRLIDRTGEACCDWRSMGEFLNTLEKNGVLLNAAFLVGHSTLRYAVMGRRADGDDATWEEVTAMCHLARQAMQEGAWGFSTGLGFVPGMFASSRELVALLEATALEHAFYATHMRGYSAVCPNMKPEIIGEPHNVLAVREQLELARRTGVPVQLAHLIFGGRRSWPTFPTVLRDIERAADEGIDVAFDAFPYTSGNSSIKVNLSQWFLDGFEENISDPRALTRLESDLDYRFEAFGRGYGDILLMRSGVPELAEYEGLDFATVAQRLGISEFEAYMRVARLSEGRAAIRHHLYSGEPDGENEEPLRAVLSHPLCIFMTDALVPAPGGGQANPAAFGTYPRVLGRYSRDLRLFTLEEAIHRMTSFPAERLGLVDMGCIGTGQWADLVLFNPETVNDHTTLERPDAPPEGIEAVLISGRLVAKNGQMVSQERHGRVLRR